MYRHPRRERSLNLPQASSGWIAIEVILCLSLLAVILMVVESQTQQQWATIQLAEQSRIQRENNEKRAAYERLTGAAIPLSSISESRTSYPNCQSCHSHDLIVWLQAIQNPISTSVTSSEADNGL